MIDTDDWDYFLTPSRREMRRERKIARRTDRSKYKKTDQKKEPQNNKKRDPELILGKVLLIRSQKIEVMYKDTFYVCTLKGTFKLDRTRNKNLLIVGDNVWFNPTTFLIHFIEPRKSFLCRQEHLHRRKQQLVAANVDQVLITVSFAEPICKPAIIDRYIIAAMKGNITPVIVFNKSDLREKYAEHALLIQEYSDLYSFLGIENILISAKTGEGLEKIRALLTDKVSVFSGQSGTGKTCLINALTGLSMRTGEVRAIGKGSHTTTFARLIPFSFGGWCVDTPGIRSFGIWELEKEDLKKAFPDLFVMPCAFANCWHQGEQGCALPDAINEGKLSPIRWNSYLALLESVREQQKIF